MHPHRLHAASKRKREVLKKKMILIILSVLTISSCCIFLGGRLVEAQEIRTKNLYQSIEIEKGQTLWEIAEHYHDSQNETIPEYIRHLKELNALDSDTIQEGQCLTVIYYE